MTNSNSPRRLDIDGLRGVAIVLVLVFHAYPRALPGGFVGVDVFFVISGFVVARMVSHQLAEGTFTARAFFLRRINRLAPALLVTVGATFLVAALWAAPTLAVEVTRSAVAALALLPNVLAGFDSSYFDASAETKPLLHLWSLGVEEQFYLAVPVAVWVLGRWPRGRGPLVGAVLVASFTACLWVSRTREGWAFYLPFTRAWELLAGVLLAQGWETVERAGPRSRQALAGLGVLLLVLAAAMLPVGRYPSAWALVPVSGAVLVMTGGGAGGWVERLLCTRAMLTMGHLSYPLYLWHWPVLVFLKLATPESQHQVAVPVALVLTLALAEATVRFIERPVRARQSSKSAWGLLAAGGMLLGSLGGLLLGLSPEQWAWRRPEWARLSRFLAQQQALADARFGTCLLAEDTFHTNPSCLEATPRELPLVFVWGDSYGGQLAAGLREVQRERHTFRIGQRTRGSCQGLLERANSFCAHANATIFDELKSEQPSVLILHSMWSSPRFRPDELRETLGLLVAALPRTRIVLVGQPPLWSGGLPWALMRRLGDEAFPARMVPARLDSQWEQDRELATIAQERGVAFVSALQSLCSLEGCLVKMKDEPLMLSSWDYGHLTTPAATLLARRLPLNW